jgi:hypothetical protein
MYRITIAIRLLCLVTDTFPRNYYAGRIQSVRGPLYNTILNATVVWTGSSILLLHIYRNRECQVTENSDKSKPCTNTKSHTVYR